MHEGRIPAFPIIGASMIKAHVNKFGRVTVLLVYLVVSLILGIWDMHTSTLSVQELLCLDCTCLLPFMFAAALKTLQRVTNCYHSLAS